MSKNLNIDEFKHTWTTNIDEFILVNDPYRDTYGIVRIFLSGVISSLIIEDDEVYLAVQSKLLDAGVKTLSYDEFMAFKLNR